MSAPPTLDDIIKGIGEALEAQLTVNEQFKQSLIELANAGKRTVKYAMQLEQRINQLEQENAALVSRTPKEQN